MFRPRRRFGTRHGNIPDRTAGRLNAIGCSGRYGNVAMWWRGPHQPRGGPGFSTIFPPG